MHDLRNEADSHEEIPQSFSLACEVGQVIDVHGNDLRKVENGKYDVIAQRTSFVVTDGKVKRLHVWTVRRVS